jgi:phosphohistidine phosphatase
MDLILWRHADAEEGYPDLARELTAKGHKQAELVAKWLRTRLPKDTAILVSPAARAQQTARALTSHFQTVEEIAPGAHHTAVLKAAGWPGAKGTVLVVGHQPTLGEVVGSLLCGDPGEWQIKKGAAWWLGQRDRDAPVILRAAIAPDLV